MCFQNICGMRFSNILIVCDVFPEVALQYFSEVVLQLWVGSMRGFVKIWVDSMRYADKHENHICIMHFSFSTILWYDRQNGICFGIPAHKLHDQSSIDEVHSVRLEFVEQGGVRNLSVNLQPNENRIIDLPEGFYFANRSIENQYHVTTAQLATRKCCFICRLHLMPMQTHSARVA